MRMSQMSCYLDDSCVLFMHSGTRKEILENLVNAVAERKKLPEKERFLQSIVDREALVSTGVGMGVAIPHAKLNIYKDFFIAAAVLKKGVEWESVDDSLVRLVFLIGGPENRPTEYLKILSQLTSAMRSEQLRKQLMTADSPKSFITILKAALNS